MLLKTIEATLNGWGQELQDFVRKYSGNPIFWGIFFVVGISLFYMTYSALQKEK